MKQLLNPDVGYLDEENVRVASLRADWDAKKPRRVVDESGDAFLTSEAWQRYLWRIDPDHELAIFKTVQRADVVTRHASRNAAGDLSVNVTIPASLFVDLDRRQAQDVYRLVTRDTYVWGMTQFGWPAPPGVPGGVPSHAAEIPVEVRGIADAEAGRQLLAHIEWEATSPRRDLRVGETLERDPAWQEYLGQVDPGSDVLFILHVVDEVDPDADPHTLWVEPDPETGEPITRVATGVRAAALTADGHSEPDAAVAAVVGAYRWAAHELGWPPPPALANGPT